MSERKNVGEITEESESLSGLVQQVIIAPSTTPSKITDLISRIRVYESDLDYFSKKLLILNILLFTLSSNCFISKMVRFRKLIIVF